MKKLGILILFFCGIGILLFGRWHWNQQIATIVAGETENVEIAEETETAAETAIAAETIFPTHISYAANLPDEVVRKLEEGYQNNEAVNLTLVARTEPSWVAEFKEVITSTYGEGVWNIQTITYDTMTSAQLLESDIIQQVVDTNPDVILYEVPLLTDNGQLGAEISIAYNSQILNQWSTAFPEVTMMVQPSHPIHQGVFYPREVEEFQRFIIEETEHIYIHHWDAWPDRDSDEMLAYLVEGSSMELNEAGYQLWAAYLIDLFVSR